MTVSKKFLSNRAYLIKRARSKGIHIPVHSHLTTGKKIAIKAMIDNGMSEWQIAAIERVSRATVNRVRHDPELQDLQSPVIEKTKKMLASRFYILSDRAISKASQDDRLEKMNSYQLAMISAVGVDKARLMEGLSTENMAVRGINEHLLKESKELDDVKNMIIKRFKSMSIERDGVPIDEENEKKSANLENNSQ